MEKIYNAQLKELYINKYKLNDIFTDDMSGYLKKVNIFVMKMKRWSIYFS